MAPTTATRAAGAKAPAGRTTPRTAPRTTARSTKAPAHPKAPHWTSRAVVRTVEAGSSVSCVACGELVKFRAKERQHQVICNVYVKGTWDRVEHFHADCYGAAGQPHGEPQEGAPTPAARRAPAATADAPRRPAPAA